jgi:hypothetical protein
LAPSEWHDDRRRSPPPLCPGQIRLVPNCYAALPSWEIGRSLFDKVQWQVQIYPALIGLLLSYSGHLHGWVGVQLPVDSDELHLTTAPAHPGQCRDYGGQGGSWVGGRSLDDSWWQPLPDRLADARYSPNCNEARVGGGARLEDLKVSSGNIKVSIHAEQGDVGPTFRVEVH